MSADPFLGLIFHWIGGLASASFYIPYRGVRKWAWETSWLVGGFFSWIVAPISLALIMTSNLFGVLSQTPFLTLFWIYLFGVLWGIGGLTFGLTMRYLGISLGMAVALGFCAAFGTLVPPIFHQEFVSKILDTHSGVTILLGVGVCLTGIGISGVAGMSKEREMSAEQKRLIIKEFDFKKGILMAIFSGVMSACFSYGLDAGQPIKALTLQYGTTTLWQGLPVLVVLLFGGFTTNLIWCSFLHARNGTGSQYFSAKVNETDSNAATYPLVETALLDAPAVEMARQIPRSENQIEEVPLGWNYLFCAIAGLLWYFQFFFYTMGESQMIKYPYSSWTLHMSSIIIFSSLWGFVLKEWKGGSRRTMLFLFLSLALLIVSTAIIGYGNYLAAFSEKSFK